VLLLGEPQGGPSPNIGLREGARSPIARTSTFHDAPNRQAASTTPSAEGGSVRSAPADDKWVLIERHYSIDWRLASPTQTPRGLNLSSARLPQQPVSGAQWARLTP